MTLVKASIPNIKALFEMSNAAFETTITSMGYSNKEVKDGHLSFSKGTADTEGRHHISKLRSVVSFDWMHRGNSNTLLDELVKQLQPCFVSQIKTMRRYQLTDGGFTYIFFIMIDDDFEDVTITRLPGVRAPIVSGQPGSRIIQVPAR